MEQENQAAAQAPQPQPAQQQEVLYNRPDPTAQMIHQGFKDIQFELRIKSLATQVKSFSGEGARNLRTWMRDMAQVGLTVNNDDEKLKVLAIQTLRGPAAEFYSRLLRRNPAITWAAVLAALRERFSDLTDVQYALQRLKRVKQNAGESVQTFAERIIDLAEEAFNTIDLTDKLIQMQLKDAFLDGIRDDAVARKIIRQRPVTLEGALTIAVAEHLTTKTFDLRRKEEPMEIGNTCAVTNDMQELHTMMTEVLALSKESNAKTSRPTTAKTGTEVPKYNGRPLKWTQDGKPICGYCSRIGHRWRQCHKRQRELQNDQGNQGN